MTHNTHAFGWILLALAAMLGLVDFRLWQAGTSPRWALVFIGATSAVLVAIVIDVWTRVIT